MPRFVRSDDVFEIELRGAILETCSVLALKKPRVASVKYSSPDAARAAYDTAIKTKLRARYAQTGASQLLVVPAPPGAGSALIVDELFAVGGASFVEEILACTDSKKLSTLAAPWLERPELRRDLLAYIDDGCDRPGHKGLVKFLFKGAEKAGDDEVMAHFMVAFDHLVRRFPVKSGWRTAEELRLASDPLVNEHVHPTAKTSAPQRFTRATRRYLCRRVFRYFRAIGRDDRARYGRAMRLALPLYEDKHLDLPMKLLDSWSLLHMLYAWSPVLDRERRGVRVVKGRALKELTPEPYFKDAWLGVLPELLSVLAYARSRTARTWIYAWLDRHYDLAGLTATQLLPLLRSANDDVVSFASKRLATARGLETLDVDTWLSLLRIENIEVAPLVVAAFETHVAPRRLTLAQCVALTHAKVAPVAELGLRWAQAMAVTDANDIIAIAQSGVERVRQAGAGWAIALAERQPGQLLLLRELFDSRFPDIRAIATAYLERRKDVDLPLWFSLLESPFDDVRALVVRHAAAWQFVVGISEIVHLASSVILAVHRGSKAKHGMLRKLAELAAASATDAEKLLPVLSVALRSVRSAERAAALAALTRAAVANIDVRAAVTRHLPELTISEQVAQ